MTKKISRRKFIKSSSISAMALGATASSASWNFASPPPSSKPNIIYILADDLGYGEVGCYGQKKIKTPNIDRLAAAGMKFTQHYSGSPVCAPSRCVLLTGKHTGHAYIRGNDEMGHRGDVWRDPALEGQRPLTEDIVTFPQLLQKQGYVTGAIGKWGLGAVGSTGDPNKKGFDFFYGYNCQRVAHNYYPVHLWKNDKKISLEGNDIFMPHIKLPEDKDPNDPESYKPYTGKHYAVDLMSVETGKFIKENKNNPFFLYLPFTIPHVSLQSTPEDLKEYEGAFEETPYKGEKGYLPHLTPRAAYAAMITRMDKEIGKVMDLIDELGLAENTLIIFTSDNGPTYNGGTDNEFFDSNGPLRGLKGSVYEGGIRVPMIAKWSGKIAPGSQSDQISAFWDIMPTLGDIAGFECPEDIDGISLLPTLFEKGEPEDHEYLYWEHLGKLQAVRLGNWKGVRLSPKEKIQLYNLEVDLAEENDVAGQNPDIVRKIEGILKSGRTPSEHFTLKEE